MPSSPDHKAPEMPKPSYYTRLRGELGSFLLWIECGGEPGDAAALECLAAAYEDREPDRDILGIDYVGDPDAS